MFFFTKFLFCKFTMKRIPHLEKDQQARNRVFVQKKRNRYKRKHFFFEKKLFCEEGRVRKRTIFFLKKNTEFVVEKMQKRMRLFKAKLFFFSKKLKRQEKTGDAKVDKKSPNNNRNQKEGQETRKKCTKKEKKNKTKRTKRKIGEKGDEKKKIEKIQEEDKNQERVTRRERKKNG